MYCVYLYHFETLQDIKDAVDNNIYVYVGNDGYQVCKSNDLYIVKNIYFNITIGLLEEYENSLICFYSYDPPIATMGDIFPNSAYKGKVIDPDKLERKLIDMEKVITELKSKINQLLFGSIN